MQSPSGDVPRNVKGIIVNGRPVVYKDWVYMTGEPVLVGGVRAGWQDDARAYHLDAPEEIPRGGWVKHGEGRLGWGVSGGRAVVCPSYVARA